MTTHELRLAAEPFEAIRNGTKVIESRLYDKKRQAIKVGDEIVFTNREHPDQHLHTRVTELLRYPTFAELFASSEPAEFGGSSTEQLLNQIRKFYVPEAEGQYGVLGIRFDLL